jgi:hypothetical protein
MDVESIWQNSVKLQAMPRSMARYAVDPAANKFLALAIYTYANNCVTKELYDYMLEICIRKDSTNLIAHYELAKLRHDASYVGLGAFLIDRMIQFYPGQQEIGRLKKAFQSSYGDNLYDKDLSFETYMNFNPHYIED